MISKHKYAFQIARAPNTFRVRCSTSYNRDGFCWWHSCLHCRFWGWYCLNIKCSVHALCIASSTTGGGLPKTGGGDLAGGDVSDCVCGCCVGISRIILVSADGYD